jgi:hypothetical protein
MSLEVRIDGAAAFKKLATQMRVEGNKDLSREMGKALTATTEPLKTSIRGEFASGLPSSGGYAGVFSKSLRWRMSRRTAGNMAQILLATFADGTSERRDIRALERGILRHPVYGRSRRIRVGVRAGTVVSNSWAVTKVRGGYHERGTEQAMDLVQAGLGEVVEDFAGRLIK